MSCIVLQRPQRGLGKRVMVKQDAGRFRGWPLSDLKKSKISLKVSFMLRKQEKLLGLKNKFFTSLFANFGT